MSAENLAQERAAWIEVAALAPIGRTQRFWKLAHVLKRRQAQPSVRPVACRVDLDFRSPFVFSTKNVLALH